MKEGHWVGGRDMKQNAEDRYPAFQYDAFIWLKRSLSIITPREFFYVKFAVTRKGGRREKEKDGIRARARAQDVLKEIKDDEPKQIGSWTADFFSGFYFLGLSAASHCCLLMGLF